MKTKKYIKVALGFGFLVGTLAIASAQDRATIAVAMPEIQGSFWVSMYYGITEEAKAQGVEAVILDAGGFDQVSKQVQQIENLVQRRPKVMIVGATSATGVRFAVEQAVNSGISVIGLGSVPEPKESLAGIVLADHYSLGKLQAECLASKLGGKGSVGMMVGPPGVGWVQDRAAGFKETLAKIAPEIAIVVEKATVTGRVEGMKLMEDWIQAFPDIDGVYTAVDDLGAGAVDALISAQMIDQVKVSSSNLSPIGEHYLRQGYIPCQSVQQIVLQGREAVRQAVELINGRDAQKFIKTPAILITEENVDQVNYSEIKAPREFRPQ